MTTIDELLNPKSDFERALLLQHLKNPFFFLDKEFYEGEKARLARLSLRLSGEIYLYLFEYFKKKYASFKSQIKLNREYETLEQFFVSAIHQFGFLAKTPEQIKYEVKELSSNDNLLQFFYDFFLPFDPGVPSAIFNKHFYSNLLQKFSSKEFKENYELVSLFRRMYATKMPQELYDFLLNRGLFYPSFDKTNFLVPMLSTNYFPTDSDYTIVLAYKSDEHPNKSIFLANLGFYIYEDTIVVNQIQGRRSNDKFREKYAEAMENIKWSKVLLGMMVNVAEEFNLKLKVISAQNHVLTKIPGHLTYERAGIIYNATAKALGFEKDSDENYVLSFQN